MKADVTVLMREYLALRGERLALRAELLHQWECNHAEHCGVPLTPSGIHAGACQWPLPKILADWIIANPPKGSAA